VGLPGIAVIGQYKQPLKWYATLTTAAHIRAYKNLENIITVRDNNNKMVFTITQREREPLKGTMHWLPLTIREKNVQDIAVNLTKDPKTNVSRIGNTNSWNFTYKGTDLSISHFVDLQLNHEETHEETQIWIKFSGRTQCVTCGRDTHWASKCPERKEKKPTKNIIEPNETTTQLRREPTEHPAETRPTKHLQQETHKERTDMTQVKEQARAEGATEKTSKADKQTTQQSNKRIDTGYQPTPPSKKRICPTNWTSESFLSSISQTPTTPNIDEEESLEEDENETPATEIEPATTRSRKRRTSD
jgi:hypothetical protein